MNYRILGKTELKVSEIGLGTWGISGNGYGPTDDQTSLKTIHKALDQGVNFIDTADSYGNGHSEELIGQVLSERRDKETIVATKVGWDFYSSGGIRGNLEPKYIKSALEKSLKRIKRDWIDIYQIHISNPEKIHSFNAYETLLQLKKEGKIRFYGVSVKNIQDGFDAVTSGVDTVQITYNIIAQDLEKEFIPFASSKGIGVIVKEPLASGLLSGKYNRKSKFHKKDHRNGWSKQFLHENLAKIDDLKFLVMKDRTLCQSAINFVLTNKEVSTTIPGAKNPKQVEENIRSINTSLSDTEKKQIKNLYKKTYSH